MKLNVRVDIVLFLVSLSGVLEGVHASYLETVSFKSIFYVYIVPIGVFCGMLRGDMVTDS